jgi:hypothetical protein
MQSSNPAIQRLKHDPDNLHLAGLGLGQNLMPIGTWDLFNLKIRAQRPR